MGVGSSLFLFFFQYCGHTTSFSVFQSIAFEFLSGLRYIHKQGIIHRDLRPMNIAVDTQGVLKILDYGLTVSAKKPYQRQHDSVRLCVINARIISIAPFPFPIHCQYSYSVVNARFLLLLLLRLQRQMLN